MSEIISALSVCHVTIIAELVAHYFQDCSKLADIFMCLCKVVKLYRFLATCIKNIIIRPTWVTSLHFQNIHDSAMKIDQNAPLRLL